MSDPVVEPIASRRGMRGAGPRRQIGRLIELQILIAAVIIAAAIFVPRVMGGEGVFMSLLVAVGSVAAIVGGFIALAFVGALPEMVRDWRTTPAAVRAAHKGNALAALQKIKPERLDARAADRFGNTALHVVCDSYEEERKRGAPAAIEFLLRHGADVNAANTYEKTPLDLAVHHGYGIETVRLLLAERAALREVLFEAAAKSGPDAVEVVKAILAAGAVVNARNILGSTPLHQAASYGSASVVRELLARGAETGARDRDGKTPLHAALWMPSLNEKETAEKVGILVAAGANRDAKDGRARTPRAMAEESGSSAVIAAMNGVSAEPVRPPPS